MRGNSSWIDFKLLDQLQTLTFHKKLGIKL